jgi:hypothetical protein
MTVFNRKLHPQERPPNEFCTKVIMARRSRPRRSYLLVEGPDDVSALQPHLVTDCSIQDFGGRDKVVQVVQCANCFRDTNQGVTTGLDGIVGIIDRDFSHLKTHESSLPHRVVQLPECNDLESLVLYHRGGEILKQFVKFNHHIIDGDSTTLLTSLRFDPKRPEQTMDDLVRLIAAPMGALRFGWQETPILSSQKLEMVDGTLAETAWQLFRKAHNGQGIKVEPLLKHFLESQGQTSTNEWHERAVRKAESLILSAQSDVERMWDLIRGKDLLDIASLMLGDLSEDQRIYPNDTERVIRGKLKQTVIAKFDAELIKSCGLRDFVDHATRKDRGRHEYFQTNGIGTA